MAHSGNPASPRIAARSSISAKPGGSPFWLASGVASGQTGLTCTTGHLRCKSCFRHAIILIDVGQTAGHTINISAAAMQVPLKHSPESIKASPSPTSYSVPAAAASAAAMHADAQLPRSSQLRNEPDAHLGSSSPHSMSPRTSGSPSPRGISLPHYHKANAEVILLGLPNSTALYNVDIDTLVHRLLDLAYHSRLCELQFFKQGSFSCPFLPEVVKCSH